MMVAVSLSLDVSRFASTYLSSNRLTDPHWSHVTTQWFCVRSHLSPSCHPTSYPRSHFQYYFLTKLFSLVTHLLVTHALM